ncbi:MAG: hypothetical protein HZA31_05610 [Opitutae bacterium]|nr:hypothetical protein [Opitutae bacterium]
MTMPSLRHSALITLFALSQLVATAAEPAILAKARAYLGGDTALAAVQSIHFTGKITYFDGSQGSIELMFQKPSRQRVIITTDKSIEVTALDDYEAWIRVQDPADATKWRLTLLGKDQIKMLRANTAEQLNFFRLTGRQAGVVEDLGDVTIDGKACRKISFKRDEGILFIRYFESATGKLVLSETPLLGGKMREEGELFAGGVRFPKRYAQTSKQQDGSERTLTIDFDKVTVNEFFPSSLFAVPSVGIGQK